MRTASVMDSLDAGFANMALVEVGDAATDAQVPQQEPTNASGEGGGAANALPPPSESRIFNISPSLMTLCSHLLLYKQVHNNKIILFDLKAGRAVSSHSVADGDGEIVALATDGRHAFFVLKRRADELICERYSSALEPAGVLFRFGAPIAPGRPSLMTADSDGVYVIRRDASRLSLLDFGFDGEARGCYSLACDAPHGFWKCDNGTFVVHSCTTGSVTGFTVDGGALRQVWRKSLLTAAEEASLDAVSVSAGSSRIYAVTSADRRGTHEFWLRELDPLTGHDHVVDLLAIVNERDISQVMDLVVGDGWTLLLHADSALRQPRLFSAPKNI